MSTTALEQIVNAVLYEGYILYPYRTSVSKNRRGRFTFGRVYPAAYSEAQRGAELDFLHSECLVTFQKLPFTLELSVGFLQPMWREVGLLAAVDKEFSGNSEPEYQVVPELSVSGKHYYTWQEAAERKVELPPLEIQSAEPLTREYPFHFPANRALEPILDENQKTAGVLVRRQNEISGSITIQVNLIAADCCKVSVHLENRSPISETELAQNDSVLMRTFASAHIALQTHGADFVSMVDPPRERRKIIENCRNIGVWPVLVGDLRQSERHTLLASPIILPDYPEVAPISPGAFFDASEIEEMLALRSMTPEEKRELRDAEGTEGLFEEHLAKLHGALHDPNLDEEFFNPAKRVETATVNGVKIRAGDKVRLHPKPGVDAMDALLNNKVAVVEAIEQDADDKLHLAVVLEEASDQDFNSLRQPGHRFLYSPEEVEPLKEAVA